VGRWTGLARAVPDRSEFSGARKSGLAAREPGDCSRCPAPRLLRDVLRSAVTRVPRPSFQFVVAERAVAGWLKAAHRPRPHRQPSRRDGGTSAARPPGTEAPGRAVVNGAAMVVGAGTTRTSVAGLPVVRRRSPRRTSRPWAGGSQGCRGESPEPVGRCFLLGRKPAGKLLPPWRGILEGVGDRLPRAVSSPPDLTGCQLERARHAGLCHPATPWSWSRRLAGRRGRLLVRSAIIPHRAIHPGDCAPRSWDGRICSAARAPLVVRGSARLTRWAVANRCCGCQANTAHGSATRSRSGLLLQPGWL
jgi:hypothetical protein